MRDVAKKGDEHGKDVWDALCFGPLTKITKAKRKRIFEVVDKNLRLIL